MPDDAAPEPVPLFIPVGDYARPSTPADERARQLVAWFHAIWRQDDDAPAVADDQLQAATLDRLDEVVAPPACGPVLDELHATVASWLAEQPLAQLVKVVVLPPCDRNDVVGTWAADHGYAVLPHPSAAALAGPAGRPCLDGEGLLVIPSLGRWFLRERNGLGHVRQLLEGLATVRRPVVVGCGSWAWSFLSMAVGADLVLPAPVTFRAFDADRLRLWLSGLATAGGGGLAFRLAKSGGHVLGPDGDDKAAKDFFARLAARSLGIPWVAWHLWRSSLRTDPAKDKADADGDGKSAADPGKQTLWISALDELVLPGHHPQVSLLVFHALLLHDQLTVAELHRVLPTANETNIVAGLVKSGFLERDRDAVRCRPAAYPAIRGGLAAAGFPMDPL